MIFFHKKPHFTENDILQKMHHGYKITVNHQTMTKTIKLCRFKNDNIIVSLEILLGIYKDISD